MNKSNKMVDPKIRDIISQNFKTLYKDESKMPLVNGHYEFGRQNSVFQSVGSSFQNHQQLEFFDKVEKVNQNNKTVPVDLNQVGRNYSLPTFNQFKVMVNNCETSSDALKYSKESKSSDPLQANKSDGLKAMQYANRFQDNINRTNSVVSEVQSRMLNFQSINDNSSQVGNTMPGLFNQTGEVSITIQDNQEKTQVLPNVTGQIPQSNIQKQQMIATHNFKNFVFGQNIHSPKVVQFSDDNNNEARLGRPRVSQFDKNYTVKRNISQFHSNYKFQARPDSKSVGSSITSKSNINKIRGEIAGEISEDYEVSFNKDLKLINKATIQDTNSPKRSQQQHGNSCSLAGSECNFVKDEDQQISNSKNVFQINNYDSQSQSDLHQKLMRLKSQQNLFQHNQSVKIMNLPLQPLSLGKQSQTRSIVSNVNSIFTVQPNFNNNQNTGPNLNRHNSKSSINLNPSPNANNQSKFTIEQDLKSVKKKSLASIYDVLNIAKVVNLKKSDSSNKLRQKSVQFEQMTHQGSMKSGTVLPISQKRDRSQSIQCQSVSSDQQCSIDQLQQKTLIIPRTVPLKDQNKMSMMQSASFLGHHHHQYAPMRAPSIPSVKTIITHDTQFNQVQENNKQNKQILTNTQHKGFRTLNQMMIDFSNRRKSSFFISHVQKGNKFSMDHNQNQSQLMSESEHSLNEENNEYEAPKQPSKQNQSPKKLNKLGSHSANIRISNESKIPIQKQISKQNSYRNLEIDQKSVCSLQSGSNNHNYSNSDFFKLLAMKRAKSQLSKVITETNTPSKTVPQTIVPVAINPLEQNVKINFDKEPALSEIPSPMQLQIKSGQNQLMISPSSSILKIDYKNSLQQQFKNNFMFKFDNGQSIFTRNHSISKGQIKLDTPMTKDDNSHTTLPQFSSVIHPPMSKLNMSINQFLQGHQASPNKKDNKQLNAISKQFSLKNLMLQDPPAIKGQGISSANKIQTNETKATCEVLEPQTQQSASPQRSLRPKRLASTNKVKSSTASPAPPKPAKKQRKKTKEQKQNSVLHFKNITLENSQTQIQKNINYEQAIIESKTKGTKQKNKRETKAQMKAQKKIQEEAKKEENEGEGGRVIKRRNRKMQSITRCPHKDMKHYAKGMCNHCYHLYGRKSMATQCQHSDRMNYARGMCQNCYFNSYNRDKRSKTKQSKGMEKTSTE